MVRRSPLVALAGLISLVALLGCQDQIKVNDSDIDTLQYKDLQAMLANTKKGPTVIVDVRQPAKYAREHIPGAINIFLPQLVENDPRLADALNIVVYGSGWTDYLSPAAAKRLMAQNYKNVYDFRGGLELWKNEGGRTEGSGEPATRPTTQAATKPTK